MLLCTIKDLDYTGTPWRHGCFNFLWNILVFDGIFWRSEMFVTGKGIPLSLFRKDEVIWIIWINVYVVLYECNWTVKQSFFYKEISYSFMFSHFWAVSGPFSEAWVGTLCPDRGAIITDNNAIRFSENQNHQDFVTKQHYKHPCNISLLHPLGLLLNFTIETFIIEMITELFTKHQFLNLTI